MIDVFPAPRKPVKTVMGTGAGGGSEGMFQSGRLKVWRTLWSMCSPLNTEFWDGFVKVLVYVVRDLDKSRAE